MPKKAISVTLATDNLLWLRGQARTAGRRSVSAVLDRLVSEARAGGRMHEGLVRSVVGTIRIADFDADLSGADSAIRALFPGRSGKPAVGARRARRGKRRG